MEDNQQFEKKDLFYCYSLNLFHFLKDKGFFYLVKGVNEYNHKTYWVFYRSQDFLNALTEWKEVRKTYK